MATKLNSLFVGIALACTSQMAAAQDLQEIYQLALQKDPTVLKAAATFRGAQESIEQARSVLLPQIDAIGSYTDIENEDDNRTFDRQKTSISLDLNMQLYHHTSWLNLENSKKTAHQSDINYQFVKQQMITRVSEAYFNVLAAYDDLEFAVAEKKSIDRQLEQTKQRFSVGLTAITDVHEAQAEYDNSVAEEIRSQNIVFQSEEALREITGVYPRDLNVLNTEKFSPFMPTPTTADAWQKLAEAKNLTLISEKISLDIAKENIDIASAGHLPTLSFNASIGKSETDSSNTAFPSDNLDGWEEDDQSIGIQLVVPIYSGGNVSSQVRAAQESYVAASQDLETNYRGIVRQSRNSFNTVVATISGIKAFEQSVISAESALKATEAGFEVGTRTIVDVLDSTRNLYNAKRNLSTTRYQYIINMLLLKQAAGTISIEDINAINTVLMVATSK